LGNTDDQLSKLSAQEKRALLDKLLKERQRSQLQGADRFGFPPEYAALAALYENEDGDGIADLFFQSFEGTNGNLASIAGRSFSNFCSYNYLGMSGDPDVSRAAIKAIETYGTSVSASRLVSGERPFHRELEQEIAGWIGVEDSIVFVGGFVTNEDTIGHLLGPDDLVVYDSLIHASVQQGALLSGARAHPFPHNNLDALDNILQRQRKQARRTLIVVEGIYSMDGDIPDLPRLIEMKERHAALLMVDEAHSLGVLGKTGRGIAEHFGADPKAVDLWMGTLSKSLASCGGYIAGSSDLVNYLRRTAPGFVYSVGISPANGAAALAALRKIAKTPERVETLRQRTRLFHTLARDAGLDTGGAHADSAVMPIIVGHTGPALALSRVLKDAGILALPIGYPAVPENKARLRFFISSLHTEEQIREAVEAMRKHKEN